MTLFTSKEAFSKVRKIAVVSDSALGFGSPDILGLCDGLCEHFGAEGLLIQPDDLNRPLVDLRFRANVRSLRVYSLLPTYTRSWRWSYFQQAGKALDKFQPDLVIAVGPNGYGGAMAMRWKPKCMVYYMLEMATIEELYARLHEYGNSRFDAYIVPDIERHAIDFGNLRWKKDVLVEPILLTAPIDYPDPLTPRAWNERNGKMIYFGHIHPEETLVDNLLSPELDDYPMEFFGRIGGSERAAIANRIASTPNKVYRGLATPPELAETLPQFAYSLVTWKPVGHVGRYHLPATKLYHSVLAGVPVIAVPNPLNTYYIRRLGVGILMDTWNRRAFNDAIAKAMATIGTDAYREMVDNCRKASETLFRWDKQVARAAALVKKALVKKWERGSPFRKPAETEAS